MQWTPEQRQVYARCSARLREALKAATDEQLLDALAAPTDIEAIARLLLATPDPVYPHSHLQARATSRKPAVEDRDTAAILDALQKLSTSRTRVGHRAPRFALEAVHRLARLAGEVDRSLSVEDLARRPTLRALLEDAEEFVVAVMEAPSFDEAIRRVEGPATDKDEAHVEKYFDTHAAGFVRKTGYMSAIRRMDAMILELLFTAEEAATLSNTVCGSEKAARALEQRGLLLVDRVEDRMGEPIAFFQLTPLGVEYVRRFFTVRENE